jgi:hypothetical protein
VSSRDVRLREVLPVGPGGCLVVGGAGLEASVQDADEPVRQPAERVVVLDPAGAELVVEGACAERGVQGREGLGVERVGEPVVVDEPGGPAWNTPAALDEIHRPRGRHLLGASRGVGVRLVRQYAGQRAATAGELAAALTGWVRSLASRDWLLRDLDEALAAALSQADGGLRPHVGTGIGERGDG